jgi:hypothetical protein
MSKSCGSGFSRLRALTARMATVYQTRRPAGVTSAVDNGPAIANRRRIPRLGPSLPYTVELNDIPMMIVQHHESDYLLKRAIDQFDRLYAEGKHRAKIMALAIHPYISGQAHRIKYLEAAYDYLDRFEGVPHWNGAEILDWYLSTHEPAVVGRE